MFTVQLQDDRENLIDLELNVFDYDIRKSESFLYITLRIPIPIISALPYIQKLVQNLNKILVVEVKDNFIPILSLYDATLNDISLLGVNKNNWLNLTFKRK